MTAAGSACDRAARTASSPATGLCSWPARARRNRQSVYAARSTSLPCSWYHSDSAAAFTTSGAMSASRPASSVAARSAAGRCCWPLRGKSVITISSERAISATNQIVRGTSYTTILHLTNGEVDGRRRNDSAGNGCLAAAASRRIPSSGSRVRTKYQLGWRR